MFVDFVFDCDIDIVIRMLFYFKLYIYGFVSFHKAFILCHIVPIFIILVQIKVATILKI